MEGLERYERILKGKEKPKYLSLKESSELKKRVENASQILESCTLCERKCKVNRLKGEIGNCGISNLRIDAAFDHLGEEPFFVPSWTIFFSGCNFHCVFCQNYSISQLHEGRDISVRELADIINSAGFCKNINLVGGSPTPFLPWILDALQNASIEKPIVWNSNFYMSKESMDLLMGLVDVWLPDWKYGNNKCAERLSSVKNYVEVIKRNHQLAFEDAEVVIRHLVLPNHFECCTAPILKYIASNFGRKVVLNLMNQYRPCWHASEYSDINRTLTREEFQKAVDLAKRLDLNFIT